MDPSELYEAPTMRKLDKHSRAVANHLAGVSRNMDFMVLWLDCDKEGENICFEVLDVCKRNIPKVSLWLDICLVASLTSVPRQIQLYCSEGPLKSVFGLVTGAESQRVCLGGCPVGP